MRGPVLLSLLLALTAGRPAAAAAEKTVTETEWKKDWAPVVAQYESAKALVSSEPEKALALLQDLLLREPRAAWEGTIVVVYSRGIARGAEASRSVFQPFLEAGRCAEALGRLEEARDYYARSGFGAAGTERVERAIREASARKAQAPRTDPAVEVREKVRALLARRDFAGALAEASARRADLGDAWKEVDAEIRTAARSLQEAEAAAVASTLGELDRPDFRATRIEPSLARCANVPEELLLEEIRWVRSLSDWCDRRLPDELDRLAVTGLSLGGGFAMLMRIAQERRVEELERLSGPSAKKGAPVAAERTAYERLAAVKRFADLDERVARAAAPPKPAVPEADPAIERASRIVSPSSGEIRELSPALEAAWLHRAQRSLGARETAELARTVAVFRISRLLLEGTRIEATAADGIVREAVAAAVTPPKGISPKVVQVWSLARR